jgi:hypothetical protein
MAYTFSVNNTPVSGAYAVYVLIANLIAAGWANKSDSDGSTYAAGGGQVTTGNSGAHGLGNTKAWVRLQAPTVGSNTREIVFQRSTNNTDWRIKYSANAGFTGGSPGTVQVPSATDEVILFGSGSDASPGFSTWLGTDNGYRWHCAAGGAPEGYCFYCFGIQTGTTSTYEGVGVMEIMATYDTGDVDPAALYMAGPGGAIFGGTDTTSTTTSCNNAQGNSNGGTGAWFGATSNASGNFQFINTSVYYSGTLGVVAGTSGSSGSLPFSGKDPQVGVLWFRGSNRPAPLGVKGYGTMLFWNGVTRTNMDTFDVAGTKDRLFMNGMSLPWSGAVPLI